MPEPTDDPDLRDFRSDAKRKQLRIPPPKTIGHALSGLMARQGYGRILATSSLAEVWKSAVGSKFAEHTRVGQVKRGVLEVSVRNSAVLQELTFAKSGIVKKLIAAAPNEKISQVKFKVGPIE